MVTLEETLKVMAHFHGKKLINLEFLVSKYC
jgi:hypothetical protein